MNTLLLAPELFASEGGIARILRLYLKALCELSEPTGSVSLVSLNDATFDSRELRRYSSARLSDWAACDRSKIAFVKAARRMSANADRLPGRCENSGAEKSTTRWSRTALRFGDVSTGSKSPRCVVQTASGASANSPAANCCVTADYR